MRADRIFGAHLWQKAAMDTKRLFTRKENYEVNGRTSALAILAFLGQKIARRCNSRYLTLHSLLTNRKPIENPADLAVELDDISLLKSQLCSQGHTLPDMTLHSALRQAISILLLRGDMNMALTIPVYACEKQNGNDGEKLLECLRDVEFELSSNPEY